MQTVNYRLLALLLAIVAAVGAGIYFLHGYQVNRNADWFLQAARAARTATNDVPLLDPTGQGLSSEYRRAIQSYRYYTNLRRDDLEPKMELAELYTTTRDLTGAIEVYEDVVGRDPTRKDARRKAAELALEVAQSAQFVQADPEERARQSSRMYTVAHDHLMRLLADAPEDAELLEDFARCQAGTGDETGAIESLKKSIAADPHRVDSYARMASLLRERLNRKQEADEIIAQLLQANADSARAQLIAGSYEHTAGNYRAAFERSKEAVRLEPTNTQALLLAVGSAALLGSETRREKPEEAAAYFDEGRQLAQKGLALSPDAPEFYLASAELESRDGKPDEAQAALKQGLDRTPNQPQLLLSLGSLLADGRNWDEADAIVKKLSGMPGLSGSANGRIEFLAGRIAAGRELWSEAISHFETARAGLFGEPMQMRELELQLGRAYGQLANTDQQIQAYRRALNIDPRFAPAQAALVDALTSQGQIDLAMDALSQLADRSPAGAALAAARLYLMRMLGQPPAQRNWTEFERLLSIAEKTPNNAQPALILRVQALAAQGRAEDAEKLLQEAIDAHPETIENWAMLLSLVLRDDTPERSQALLGKARERFGDTVEIRLVEARQAARYNGELAAGRVAELADKSDAFSDDDRVRLWAGLVSIASQVGNPALAERLARQVAEKRPQDLNIRFTLLETELRDLQEVDAARKLLDEIGAIENKGPVWRYGQALLLSKLAETPTDPRLDEALRLLNEAKRDRPRWARLSVLMGSIYDRRGNTDDAMSNFQTAINLGDRNPTMIRRYAQMLSDRRRYAEAQEVLGKLGGESSDATQRLESRLAWQTGDLPRSLAAAQLAAKESKLPQDHLWLGGLLAADAQLAQGRQDSNTADKRRAEAEASFKHAIDLDSDNAAAWVTLVRFLNETQQTEKLEAALKDAAARIAPNQAALVLGGCYETIGRPDDAGTQYAKALTDAPDDMRTLRAAGEFYWHSGKREKGKEIARRVIDGKVKAEPDDMNWARRLLAVLLADEGGPANLQESLQLIEGNLRSAQAAPIDGRIKVSLLLAHPSRAERRKAIGVFESLLESERQLAPNDQFALARLYLSEGDWTKYAAQMQRMITDQPGEPQYLAHYINALLQRDAVTEAELYLNRLAQLAPQNYETIALRAEALFRRGKTAEALDELKRFIDLPNAAPPQRSLRMRLVAERLQQLADRLTDESQRPSQTTYRGEAESLFRQYVALEPSQAPALVAILAKLDQGAAAVDLLDRSWSSFPPTAMTQAVIECLRSGRLSDSQRSQCEQIMLAALGRWNRPPLLLLTLGDMCGVQNRTEEAERYYREVIGAATNPAPPAALIAMNNLAVLLAQQNRNLDEALQLINRAIDGAGRVPSMLDTRASVYLAMGQPEKAISDLQEAIADADEPVRLFHQALAYQKAGDTRRANEVFAKAVSRGLKREELPAAEQPAFDALQPPTT